ncbi:hypothetical protein KW508_06495 [Vibrio fluvialis]|nr:hypothetical protein [Vibrio fluvialis]
MEFGFLKSCNRYVSDSIEIRPLWDVEESIYWLETEAEISDGWIYPPIVEAKKLPCERHSKKFSLPSSYHLVPATHSIIFRPYSEQKARFLILGIGFFFGVYLSPAEYYNIDRVAYKVGKLTGVSPRNGDIELALEYLSRFYDTNPKKRQGMFAVIHWFLLGQSYNHPWDRFEAQYKVLDGLFKLSGISVCSHGLRPNKLAEKYNIQIPTWAEVIDGKSLLSRLRNDLAHEAIYAGEPIGYAHPKENYDIDFSSFNVKLIASILGVKTNYLATSSQDRQLHLWHIV